VVGGIIVSTLMSLFIVPATFTVFDDFQQWLAHFFKRGAHAEGAHAAPAHTEATDDLPSTRPAT
jgi:hypothetical protein